MHLNLDLTLGLKHFSKEHTNVNDWNTMFDHSIVSCDFNEQTLCTCNM